MSRGLFIFFALLWASFLAPQKSAAVIALPSAKLHPLAYNLHSRTNGGLSQIFITDTANDLTNVTRNGTSTLTGATPAPATNVTVNGQAAQIYGDFTFACPNLTLTSGINLFTNIAVNLYGTKVTNIVTVNLPQKVTVSYDRNSSITNDGALSFGYDSENQLTNITLAGGWKSDFVYDGLNRRRIERDYTWTNSAWSKTSEVHYIYDGYLLVQERDTNDNVLVTYTRGLDFSGSLQGAGGVCGLLARTDSSGTIYYHSDAVGNVTALMDGSENIVGRYLYGPNGNPLAMSGAMAFSNVMRSFSEPVHSLSGLLHLPFRDLNTRMPIFLTADPLGEAGGIPLHGFAANNALRHIDPWGWQAEKRDVRPETSKPEVRPPAERFLPNGQPRTPSFEERLKDQLEKDATAYEMRRQGLDPNQSYIGPANTSPSSVSCPTVIRYVSQGEANFIRDNGFIPNVNAKNEPKQVFVTPDELEFDVSKVEAKYKIGSQDPNGPQASPTHAVIANGSGISYSYGGNVAGGSGTELTTYNQIPALLVIPLKGGK
jgi:YD repeat-containing protein